MGLSSFLGPLGTIADIVSGGISLANKAVAYFTKRGDQQTGANLQAQTDKAASIDVAQSRVDSEIAVGQESTDQLRQEVSAEGRKQ